MCFLADLMLVAIEKMNNGIVKIVIFNWKKLYTQMEKANIFSPAGRNRPARPDGPGNIRDRVGRAGGRAGRAGRAGGVGTYT